MIFPHQKPNIFKRIKWRFKDAWDLIRYDIPYFFKNLWRFRKEMWNYRDWDYHHALSMLRASLFHLCEYIDKKGLEIDESRKKKVYYMKRSIYLIDIILKDDFIELAEKRLGYELSHFSLEFEPIEKEGETFYSLKETRSPEEVAKDRKLFDESSKIEKEIWLELFEILQGNHFKADFLTDSSLKGKSYEEFMDGKGLINWWD